MGAAILEGVMSEDISVESILKKSLLEMEAEGLCNAEAECGCAIGELAPCGYLNLSGCVAARKVVPPPVGFDIFFTPIGGNGVDPDEFAQQLRQGFGD